MLVLLVDVPLMGTAPGRYGVQGDHNGTKTRDMMPRSRARSRKVGIDSISTIEEITGDISFLTISFQYLLNLI